MKLNQLMVHASLALGLGDLGYCVAACQHVLTYFPTHLRALTLLGQALLDRGRFAEAAEQFERVLELDPENVVSRAGLAAALERQGQVKRAIDELSRAVDIAPGNTEVRDAWRSMKSLLDRRAPDDVPLSPAARAKVLTARGDHADAIVLLAEASAHHPRRRELALARADALWAAGRWDQAATVALGVARDFPTTLKAQAILARHLIHKGDHPAATAIIHDLRAIDPSDSVLGPVMIAASIQLPPLATAIDLPDLDLPVPLEVERAVAAGVDDMTAWEPADDMPTLEPASGAKSSLGSLVADLKRNLIQLADDLAPLPDEPRRPAAERGGFAIVTIATHLRRKYGERAAGRIHKRLVALRDVLREKGFQADVVFLDQPEPMAALGLQAAASAEPAALRGAIRGLDAVYGARSSQLGHLLIIGGPDIVPFFDLANPAEDDDRNVPSDVPYAALGANYFGAGHAVGRLPDAAGPNPDFLLQQIDAMIARYRDEDLAAEKAPRLLKLLNPLARGEGQIEAFGYAAAVWRGAAEHVFARMGDVRDIRLCPPDSERSVEAHWLHQRDFFVFNLHGTEHSPNWYGQKDDSYPDDFPLFPIALAPDNLDGIDIAGAIVFTEACYGGNIGDKGLADALCLRLLERGAACVIGSTRIAYGSSEPPLTGADLLAHHVWEHLLAGETAGQALVSARAAYLAQVNRRQGYLDGDDQKTLIAFTILGDPGARLRVHPARAAAQAEAITAELQASPKSLDGPLYCKVRAHHAARSLPKGDLISRATRWLTSAAPEIGDASIEIVPRAVCSDPALQGGAECGSCSAGDDSGTGGSYLVTSQKSIALQDGTRIKRIARATINAQGDLIKISISK